MLHLNPACLSIELQTDNYQKTQLGFWLILDQLSVSVTGPTQAVNRADSRPAVSQSDSTPPQRVREGISILRKLSHTNKTHTYSESV